MGSGREAHRKRTADVLIKLRPLPPLRNLQMRPRTCRCIYTRPCAHLLLRDDAVLLHERACPAIVRQQTKGREQQATSTVPHCSGRLRKDQQLLRALTCSHYCPGSVEWGERWGAVAIKGDHGVHHGVHHGGDHGGDGCRACSHVPLPRVLDRVRQQELHQPGRRRDCHFAGTPSPSLLNAT